MRWTLAWTLLATGVCFSSSALGKDGADSQQMPSTRWYPVSVLKKSFPAGQNKWIDAYRVHKKVKFSTDPLAQGPEFDEWEIIYYQPNPMGTGPDFGTPVPGNLFLRSKSRSDPSLAYSATLTNPAAEPGELSE